MRKAVRAALDLLQARYGMAEHLAYAYLSAATDFDISQVVDIVCGVHAASASRTSPPSARPVGRRGRDGIRHPRRPARRLRTNGRSSPTTSTPWMPRSRPVRTRSAATGRACWSDTTRSARSGARGGVPAG
jgi:hypothetical protein